MYSIKLHCDGVLSDVETHRCWWNAIVGNHQGQEGMCTHQNITNDAISIGSTCDAKTSKAEKSSPIPKMTMPNTDSERTRKALTNSIYVSSLEIVVFGVGEAPERDLQRN